MFIYIYEKKEHMIKWVLFLYVNAGTLHSTSFILYHIKGSYLHSTLYSSLGPILPLIISIETITPKKLGST